MQAYIAYLHKMIEAHEDIQEKQSTMIRLLEDQVKDLSRTAEIYRESYDTLKELSKSPSGAHKSAKSQLE